MVSRRTAQDDDEATWGRQWLAPLRRLGAGPAFIRFALIVAIAAVVSADEGPAAPPNDTALDSVPDEPVDETKSKAKPKRYDDLGQAATDAAKRRTGVFILFTADWCPWCKKELKVFDNAPVAAVLEDWTVAVIDVDEHPKIAKRSGVESLPTLQVQTMDGRIIASQNGFMDADELVAWLDEHREALVLSGEEFVGDDPPTDDLRERLFQQFQSRNPVAREAAIQRLLKHRQHAARDVVRRLEIGPLQTRLAAWDLLHEWNAPVDKLDPWRPETLTPEALAEIKAWAVAVDPSLKDDDPLSPEQAIEIDEDISALLRSDDPAQVRTIREKLARHGRKLLPIVYARLAKAQKERDRQRLTVLRYRLAAPTAFVLRWPNGLERLVEGNVDERHAAVMELTQHASPAEEGLLLELFSDPDPFVRELCLRALREVGGSSANMALLRLLDDPSPDVRAAVLGQFAEAPSPQVVPQLSAYIEKETDADLVVHAVRALRAVGNESALESLLTLFEHAGWHVRAEAVEAVGEILQKRRRSSQGDLPRQAQIYAAIMSRLTDDDSFVVSRAVAALRPANFGASVEPMAQAALRKPELAGEIVQAIAALNGQSRLASEFLRDFATHADARLRAAALSGLLTINDRELHSAVQNGLADPERPVRVAAAQSLFELLNRELPIGSSASDDVEENTSMDGRIGLEFEGEFVEEVVTEETPTTVLGALFKTFLGGGIATRRTIRRSVVLPASPGGADSDLVTDDSLPADADDVVQSLRRRDGPAGNDAELTAYYRRTDRPDWQTAAVGPLLAMLSSDDVDERRAAALCLVPLGQPDAAWPILLEDARRNPAALNVVARALPWLVWDRRRALFEELLSQPAARQQIGDFGAQFASVKDRRSQDYLWTLLADESFPLSDVANWHSLMHLAYGLAEHQYQNNGKPSRKLLDEWSAFGSAGAPIQRLMAASLVYQHDRERAAEMARRLALMTDAPAAVRADAWQIALLGDNLDAAREQAVNLLRDPEQPHEVRRLALGYLAIGSRALSYLRWTRVWIDAQAYYGFNFAGNDARVAGDWGDPPSDVTPHDLRPFLEATNDPEASSQAAFLAVWIHGDRLAWQTLLELWRQRRKDDAMLHRLTYRAITALDDESLVPLLVQIYDELKEDHGEVKEFYWTIRHLSGPDVLRLRKRIRDEVGMDQLKN
jgi:HEAT repeat protein/thiol-disulfide isomerase/thioredoxin